MLENVPLRAAELKIDLLHNIIMIILVHCSCDIDHLIQCRSHNLIYIYIYNYMYVYIKKLEVRI